MGLPLGPKRIERAAAGLDELSAVGSSQPFARAV
jgi:hypothetical protein